MNRHHSAAIANHVPLHDDVLNNSQPVPARVCHGVPGTLAGRASTWLAVFVYGLVKIGWPATFTRIRDCSRLECIEPVKTIVVLFDDGRGSTLQIGR